MYRILISFCFVLLSLSGWSQETKIDYKQIKDGTAIDQVMVTGSDNTWEIQPITNFDQDAVDVPITDAGGYFTATDVEGALQELGAAGGGGTDDQTAVEVPITDAGGFYTGTEVEAALQEVGADAADLRTLSGTTDGDTNLGTFTGTTIADNETVKGALQDLEDAIDGGDLTDDQTISQTTDQLSISGGNSITLSIDDLFSEEVFEVASTQSSVTISGTFPSAVDGIKIWRNGLIQRPGVGEDYTIAGQTVTFNRDLVNGDTVVIEFIK